MAKSFLLDTRGMVANTIDGELKGYLGHDFNGNQYLIDENGLPHLIPDKQEIFKSKDNYDTVGERDDGARQEGGEEVHL